MGLFGLVYTVFGIGCKGFIGIKNSLIDDKNRNLYRNDETNTYYDHDMNRRDLITNHAMSISKDIDGNIWLRDAQTGKYVKNLSADRAEKKYQEEKAKALKGESDRTHIKYGDDEHRTDEFPGFRYKDLKTGKLYVERYMIFTDEHRKMLHLWSSPGRQDKFSVLFDPENRKIIRFTDRTIESMIGQGALMEDINKFLPLYIKEYEEKMAEPFNTWYKERLYYLKVLPDGFADTTKDKFIQDAEARVKYRRYGTL